MQVEAKTGEKFPAMISAIGKKLNRVTNICKKNLLNHSIFIYRGINVNPFLYNRTLLSFILSNTLLSF